MATIPGWVYILIGGVMCSMSTIIGAKVKTNSLTLFFYIGVVFIIIGMFKLFLRYFKSKREDRLKRVNGQMLNMKASGNVKGRIREPGKNINNPINQAQSKQLSGQANQSNHVQTQHQAHHQNQPGHHISKAHPVINPHPTILTCPKCGTKHYAYANFCMMCGSQIRFR
jgi:hypothetical protein